MAKYVGLILASTLTSLALLHVYWGLGGTWGFQKVLPTLDGKNLINPTPMDFVL